MYAWLEPFFTLVLVLTTLAIAALAGYGVYKLFVGRPK